ncbi:MAG: strawberry notch C-terminal domain-containing protein [Alphaproteobacteria bacterium]|nr:strawberry notch C-terminal domain-containing protein [Alphaproteobacteria bacterium]
MDGRKQILIFSDAGGTGRSYHADLGCDNQRQRIHPTCWSRAWRRADNAIQGLGHTNRTNQPHAPIFRPVSTDVKGEKRFLSTIACRLDTLGAMTKGHRETGGQGMFRAEDNLESREARTALQTLFRQIQNSQFAGCSEGEFKDQTGLRLSNDQGEETFPQTTRFRNRLLALPIAMQNMLYEQFARNLDDYIADLKESGQYNVGIETLTVEHMTTLNCEEVYHDPHTGAKAWCWQIARMDKLYIH